MITDAIINFFAGIVSAIVNLLPDVHFLELTPPDFTTQPFFPSAANLLVALDWIIPIHESLKVTLVFFLVASAFLLLWAAMKIYALVKP